MAIRGEGSNSLGKTVDHSLIITSKGQFTTSVSDERTFVLCRLLHHPFVLTQRHHAALGSDSSYVSFSLSDLDNFLVFVSKEGPSNGVGEKIALLLILCCVLRSQSNQNMVMVSLAGDEDLCGISQTNSTECKTSTLLSQRLEFVKRSAWNMVTV